ncbi:MAG TPA: hypothetical protein VFI30_02785, partial [Nocardioidaceae bacterium]|nr:hypothetical protein [Nocardioidaceae bacterium]
MAVRLRSVSAIAALALTAAVAPVASTPAEAAAVVGVGSAGATVTVSVHGRLVVVPAETPGGRTAYGVALSGGDIVPVRGHFDPDARTGDHVQARLALPSSIASSLPGTAGTAVTAGSDAGRTALRLVDRREETLRLAGEPSVTAPTAAAVTPVQHQQYVAAVDNLGALGQTDAELLGHVSTVGSYWKGESEGAISISVPGAVRHYRTSLPTTDCGLGDDFFNVVDDAEAQFPGIDPFSGTDQLVLFVPPTCASGSTVGMGSIGVSFASGGVLVVKAGSAINGTYAHETGHNYGFGHANARIGADSLEYYGVYDVMGFAIGGFNQLTALSTPYRVFQGITQPGEVQAVPLGDGSAPMQDTVTIKPRSDDTGVRSVRVTDPDTGEALYLDYRTGTGQDAGSFYATPGYFLDSSDGPLHYAPGVVVTAAHDISGVDDFVTSDTGDTSTPAGGTWSNESGSLLVRVTAASSTSATVTISYVPSGDWVTVGTPTIAGDLEVGGSATLDIGTWSPTPAAVQVRWAADGQPVPGTDDQQVIALGPDLAGKSLSAAVTA